MITRLAAAAVGLAILLPAIIFGGTLAVEIVVGIVLVLCVYEYASMAFADDLYAGMAWTLLGAGAVWGTAVFAPAWLGATAAAAVLATLAWVVFRPGPELSAAADRAGRYLLGMGWIGGFLAFLPMVRRFEDGVWWVVLVLAISWLGDTGGYFAGRAFGKHKLYPRISPKKTWEGLAGGVALTTAGVYLIRALGLPELSHLDCIVMGVGFGAMATVGDLSESMLKRAFDVKDSGKIMPGHGGLLDRIDSVLFVSPLVWAWAVILLGQ